MPDIAGATAVGGLVVQNGRQKGARVPLRLPVTVIGSGPGCDVRLTAAGVGPVHCVVVVTPAGPAVRSLFPGATRVNGRPTAAALLSHDDELAVGPCVFRLGWNAEPTAPPADAPAAEFEMRGREEVPHEQEDVLAAVVAERDRQLRGLLDQLAGGREQLRQERAAAAADRAEAKAKLAEALQLAAARKQAHARTLKAAARLWKGTKAKCTAELTAARGERIVAAEERSVVARDRAAVAADRERLRAEAAAGQARLQEAWAMVAEAQDRLAAERHQTEQELSHLFRMLDARTAATAEAEQKLEADRQSFDARRQALQEEVAGLEQRAANLRESLDALERRRSELAAAAPAGDGFVPEALPVMGPVPLDRPDDRSAEELLELLRYREQELEQEHKALAAAKAELDRRAGDLADGRAVLDEQSGKLEAARREWQAAEAKTVADLEALARDTAGREAAVAAREAALDRADAGRRARDRDLGRFQAKLERWQAALTAHEARSSADRDQADAALAARRAVVADQEAGLAEVCRVWSEVRAGEREALKAECGRWAEGRAKYAAGLAGLDRKRQDVLADAGRLAGLAVALEQAKQEWEKAAGSPAAARRLRVLRKRWESRFNRLGADLARRRAALESEAAALDGRYEELHRLLADVAEKRADLAAAQQAADRAKLAAAPQPADDGEPVILSLAEARRAKSEEELESARAEADRVALELRRADDRAGLVRLRPVA
jgi:chromosome segregation ATPase